MSNLKGPKTGTAGQRCACGPRLAAFVGLFPADMPGGRSSEKRDFE